MEPLNVVAWVLGFAAGAWTTFQVSRACVRGAPEKLPLEEHLPLRGRWLRILWTAPFSVLMGLVAVVFVYLAALVMMDLMAPSP
jgi:hypothetical protein